MKQQLFEQNEQVIFPKLGCTACVCSSKKKCCKKFKKKGIHCKKCPKL